MAHVPTATKVLDGFLAARAASGAPPTLDRDREVVDWLRDCLDARGAEPLDDLTAYLLSHSTGRLPTDRELAAVLSVVECIPEFFNTWLATTVGASPTQLAHAALVVQALGRWLRVRELVDDDVCEHLARYTRQYESVAVRDEATATPGRG